MRLPYPESNWNIKLHSVGTKVESGSCECEDSHKDEVGIPEVQESRKWPKGLLDVGVVAAGLRDGGAQLGVAQSSDHGHEAAKDPHDEGETH